ncbi:prefoldin subunit alpha [Candidatus Micrarchaeota archaeon]|nr:prefoldin subunit alpha [Candidatus Micrarchaeota archaeon]
MDNQSKKLLYEAQLYSEQLRLLEGEIERISMTAIELSTSLNAIAALEENDMFMQVGGGAMVSGKITSTQVIIPVGAGYMVSMEKETAVTEVKRRIKTTENAVTRLKEEFTKISTKLKETNLGVEKLNAK